MNTDLPNQQPPKIQDSAPPPEGNKTSIAIPVQDAVDPQSSTSSPKNNIIIIIFLVSAVILLAGFFAYTKISGDKNTNSPTVLKTQPSGPTAIISPTSAVATAVEPTLSASDEIEFLQKDINGTDVTSMDQDAKQFDLNLQGL